MKLSESQIQTAAAWWAKRLAVVKRIDSDSPKAREAEARSKAVAPSAEQLEAFEGALKQRLAGEQYGILGTASHNFALESAAREAGIQWERFQPGISMHFEDGNVTVYDGFGCYEAEVLYEEPLTDETALEALASNVFYAKDSGRGDARGDRAIDYVRERLKEPRWRVGDERHVELWAAIDELIGACGGNRQAKSVQRMTCVARVERALTALAGEPNPMRTDR